MNPSFQPDHTDAEEQLTPETEPDFGPDRIPSPPSLPNLRPLLDHNPWAENFDPDPHNNFTTFEFTSGNGGGRVSFSTRTFMTGGSLGMNVRAILVQDDADV